MAAADKIFVDTSVLVHAHDLDSGLKRAIAEHVLKQLWQDETGVLSTQVLQEFYAALTSGIASPVPRRAARDLIHAYSVWPVVTLDAADVQAASDFEERYRVGFRDALIVAAARKSGATLLLSDTLQPYRPIAGAGAAKPARVSQLGLSASVPEPSALLQHSPRRALRPGLTPLRFDERDRRSRGEVRLGANDAQRRAPRPALQPSLPAPRQRFRQTASYSQDPVAAGPERTRAYTQPLPCALRPCA